jgi:hypothetical protein
LLAQRIVRGPTATDPENSRSNLPHHAHERRGRHTKPVAKISRVENSTAQLAYYACHETILRHADTLSIAIFGLYLYIMFDICPFMK